MSAHGMQNGLFASERRIERRIYYVAVFSVMTFAQRFVKHVADLLGEGSHSHAHSVKERGLEEARRDTDSECRCICRNKTVYYHDGAVSDGSIKRK